MESILVFLLIGKKHVLIFFPLKNVWNAAYSSSDFLKLGLERY